MRASLPKRRSTRKESSVDRIIRLKSSICKTSSRARVIVLGNEKGGSGKSTTAMHIFVALARTGQRIGAVDLDVRQQSFFRYLENREAFAKRKDMQLLMPVTCTIRPSQYLNRNRAENEEFSRFSSAIEELCSTCDVVIIDCPGSDSYLSRLGHAAADTLISPMNDSFIDFDLFARIDTNTQEIIEPSVYSEMVWESRKLRAEAGLSSLDWVVMLNRVSTLDANNKRRISTMLDKLSKRIGFRVAPGFCERTIFRELFLNGLTLLDLRDPNTGVEINMSHIAARQEVRELLSHLRLKQPNTQPVSRRI
jgi:chromosome partitioning protein